jgi:hypothetical protein
MTLLPTERNTPVIDIAKLKVVIYGPPKVGKSTLATRNPKALVLDTDSNGTAFLDCYRVPIDNWETLKMTLGELAAMKKEDCKFDTIVLDTVDQAWNMCRAHVCKQFGVVHESEDKGFGRVWDAVKQEFMKAVAFITSNGWGLWIISHSITKEVKIGAQKRNVTCFTLPDKAGRLVAALADIIIYMDDDDEGKRTLFLRPTDTLECGDRTKQFTDNIKFTTEEEAYATLTKKKEN